MAEKKKRTDVIDEQERKELEQIANDMLHYCYGRKTVVFLPLIATSQKFCQMLNA